MTRHAARESDLTLADGARTRHWRARLDGATLVQTTWTDGSKPKETVRALTSAAAAAAELDKLERRRFADGYVRLQDFDAVGPGGVVFECYGPVLQLEKADCGLAALAMVALRRRVRVSVEELRQRVTPGPEGLTLQQLRQLAAAVGLPCQSARVSVARLGQVSLPVIAHLSDGHYVVLHEVGPGGVVVGDPATGIVTWSEEQLRLCSSGVLLLFDGTHPSPPDRAEAPAAERPRPGEKDGARAGLHRRFCDPLRTLTG